VPWRVAFAAAVLRLTAGVLGEPGADELDLSELGESLAAVLSASQLGATRVRVRVSYLPVMVALRLSGPAAGGRGDKAAGGSRDRCRRRRVGARVGVAAADPACARRLRHHSAVQRCPCCTAGPYAAVGGGALLSGSTFVYPVAVGWLLVPLALLGQAAAQPVRLVLSLAAITAGCWLLAARPAQPAGGGVGAAGQLHADRAAGRQPEPVAVRRAGAVLPAACPARGRQAWQRCWWSPSCSSCRCWCAAARPAPPRAGRGGDDRRCADGRMAARVAGRPGTGGCWSGSAPPRPGAPTGSPRCWRRRVRLPQGPGRETGSVRQRGRRRPAGLTEHLEPLLQMLRRPCRHTAGPATSTATTGDCGWATRAAEKVARSFA